MDSLSYEIASRLMRGGRGKHRLSGPAVRVATVAVALGLAIMIVSVAIGYGFKREIRNKIVGFGSHVQVTSLNLNTSFETSPLTYSESLASEMRAVSGVRSVQPFITKPGIIKTEEAFQGIALKGVDRQFDWSFIRSILVEGDVVETPDSAKSNDIILSRYLADLLCLTVGEPVRMFFVQDGGVRARRFVLSGIFDSHFDEFDKTLAYVDMRHLAQVNKWNDNQISGYEILIDDFDNLETVASEIADITSAVISGEEEMMKVRSIKDLQPQIFGWLALLDQNIVVILVLIICVAGLNMVSGLLILILEHTNTIGILKAVGATNGRLRSVFILMALKIVGRGLILGDVVGVALCLVQAATGVVGLDPENYYLDTVPVLLTWWHFVLLNIGTAVVAFVLLLGPSGMVARISPAKSIRFN